VRIGPDGQSVPPPVSTTDAQHIQVETETLIQFRNKVDALLKDLDGSPASTQTISQQTLVSGKLGTGFAEAADLSSAYSKVHAKLQELSTALSNQIEAMTLTINIAHYGYQNVEEQQVSQLWTIYDQTSTAYQQAQQPQGGGTASTDPASATTQTQTPSSTSSSGGTSQQGM
jgi:hypothetical protein